jgi:hypothetical protein
MRNGQDQKVAAMRRRRDSIGASNISHSYKEECVFQMDQENVQALTGKTDSQFSEVIFNNKSKHDSGGN